MEMSKFTEFIKQVIEHTFLGADNIAKTGGVVALFIASFKFPELPWWASVGLLVMLIFYGTYKAWREEQQNRIALQQKLANLHDQIPQFTISKGDVRKYSVSNLLEHYRQQAEDLKTPPVSASASIVSPFSVANAALVSATQNIALAAQMAGVETKEDKIARIESHVEKLRALEDALSCTYSVGLSNESPTSLCSGYHRAQNNRRLFCPASSLPWFSIYFRMTPSFMPTVLAK